jgi:hypothetical protein
MPVRAAPCYLLSVFEFGAYMTYRTCVKVAGLLVLGAIALAGCRMEEQGRVSHYEPGVYKGKADPSLNEDQRRALRQRSLYPNPGTVSGTEGARTGPSAAPQTIHQPEVRIDPSIARAKLNSRIQFQRDSGI